MTKKIYSETLKKWLIGGGITSGTLLVGLFLYLNVLGAIDITGYSGDSICAGTIDDPCYAYINLTAKEDIFIYPIGYDPWGRNTPFQFDPGVKSWELQRSWGIGWRDIPLNETCTGTWCGAPNNKGVAYSYVLREGKDYQFRIVAYKNSPYDDIKWAVNYEDKEYLDPIWNGTYEDIPGISRKDYLSLIKIRYKLESQKIDYYLTNSDSISEERMKNLITNHNKKKDFLMDMGEYDEQ